MAVVQYTAIVNQVRGKLNGSVFNKSKNAYTLQRKQQSARGMSQLQSMRRQWFSHAQRTWKTLSKVTKETWAVVAQQNPARDRFGEQTVLSGYNQFIKAFVFARMAGVESTPTPTPIPAPPVPPINLSVLTLFYGVNSAGNIIFDYSIGLGTTADLTGFYVIVDTSLPVSHGVSDYYGRWVFMGAQVGEPDLQEVDGGGPSLAKFPLPETGSPIFVRVKIVHAGTGQLVFDERLQHIVD